MKLTSISAFKDNYIWVLSDEEGKCVIVDPGEAAPILKAIAQHQWQPVAILLTHHHSDHVGGVPSLKESYPDIAIYGPAEIKISGMTQIVKGGDSLKLLGHDFSVIATPGHTLGHVSYFLSPIYSAVTRSFQQVADAFLRVRLSKCISLFNVLTNSPLIL